MHIWIDHCETSTLSNDCSFNSQIVCFYLNFMVGTERQNTFPSHLTITIKTRVSVQNVRIVHSPASEMKELSPQACILNLGLQVFLYDLDFFFYTNV